MCPAALKVTEKVMNKLLVKTEDKEENSITRQESYEAFSDHRVQYGVIIIGAVLFLHEI